MLNQAVDEATQGPSQFSLAWMDSNLQRASPHASDAGASPVDVYTPLAGGASSPSANLAQAGFATPSWRRLGDSRSMKALVAYSELLREPTYAANLAAMVTSTVGIGILNASLLTVLAGVAAQTGAMSVNTMENFQRLERLLHGLSMFVAHVGVDTEYAHQDDEQALLLATRTFSRAIVGCSVVDALSCVVIASSVAGVVGAPHLTAPLLGAATLVYPVALVRAAQAFKMATQYGFWDCLKKHLGDEPARRRQQRWNRTIVALEMILFSTLADSGSYATYKGSGRFCKDPGQTLHVGAALALVGGFLACMPKLFFCYQARHANRMLMRQGGSINRQQAEI